MPDISMCPGEGCKDREECYRAMAVPNGDRQSWMPTPGKDKTCGYFMPLWDKSEGAGR